MFDQVSAWLKNICVFNYLCSQCCTKLEAALSEFSAQPHNNHSKTGALMWQRCPPRSKARLNSRCLACSFICAVLFCSLKASLFWYCMHGVKLNRCQDLACPIKWYMQFFAVHPLHLGRIMCAHISRLFKIRWLFNYILKMHSCMLI